MSKITKITKAVIPAAGFGTRFLPITKSIPKEMLPVIDKPIIQIVVEELVEAGIKDIILVVSPYKRAIEDYFNPHFELETLLEKNNKAKELKEIRRLFRLANFIFIRQKQMGGNGDAILTAAPAVGNDPFLAFWGDDFMVAKPSRARQLLAAFEKCQSSVLATIRTQKAEDGAKYGFAVGKTVDERIIKVEKLIEKPGIGKAPSPWAVICGAYTPAFFSALEKAKKKLGEGKELYYIDGLNILRETDPLFALELANVRYYDAGNKLDYLKTVVEFGLKHKEVGKKFREYLNGIKK
ncbi:UTP--glucose-1-phosphate uridylyltransferase [Candidatus Shapirobacteria bacterium]|nr:UTP--glucose-1-phosphate uridylyltransferase [Candidatus Shapirobacteria bacterium]